MPMPMPMRVLAAAATASHLLTHLRLAIPQLPHWIPLVGPSIFAFFVLNTYLHSGFSFAWLETLLPLLMIDSSAYHNVHHEKVTTHFGEISSFWDFMLGTSDIYADGARAGYRWHLGRHRERSGAASAGGGAKKVE